jgi:hypothetical protein
MRAILLTGSGAARGRSFQPRDGERGLTSLRPVQPGERAPGKDRFRRLRGLCGRDGLTRRSCSRASVLGCHGASRLDTPVMRHRAKIHQQPRRLDDGRDIRRCPCDLDLRALLSLSIERCPSKAWHRSYGASYSTPDGVPCNIVSFEGGLLDIDLRERRPGLAASLPNLRRARRVSDPDIFRRGAGSSPNSSVLLPYALKGARERSEHRRPSLAGRGYFLDLPPRVTSLTHPYRLNAYSTERFRTSGLLGFAYD